MHSYAVQNAGCFQISENHGIRGRKKEATKRNGLRGEGEEGIEQNIVSRANGPMGGGEVKTERAGHQV